MKRGNQMMLMKDETCWTSNDFITFGWEVIQRRQSKPIFIEMSGSGGMIIRNVVLIKSNNVVQLVVSFQNTRMISIICSYIYVCKFSGWPWSQPCVCGEFQSTWRCFALWCKQVPCWIQLKNWTFLHLACGSILH